jgi:hypothetical protein
VLLAVLAGDLLDLAKKRDLRLRRHAQIMRIIEAILTNLRGRDGELLR